MPCLLCGAPEDAAAELDRLRAALAEQLAIDDDVRLKHHADGTETEEAAALKVFPRAGSLRHEVLRYLLEGPGSPTPFIERTGHNETSIRPRFTELKRHGWIAPTGDKFRTRNRADEDVYELTLAARELLREET